MTVSAKLRPQNSIKSNVSIKEALNFLARYLLQCALELLMFRSSRHCRILVEFSDFWSSHTLL